MVSWGENGIEFKADPKHTNQLVEQMGLSKISIGSMTSGEKDEAVADEKKVDAQSLTRFRALAVGTNYLAQDPMDIQYVGKERCRRLSSRARRTS